MLVDGNKIRILAVSQLWQGGNDYAFVRALRRMGHSVRAVNPKEFEPSWSSRGMRLIRKVMRRQVIREFNDAILREAEWFRPDLFFVFKGHLLQAETLRRLKARGTICIQFYPDTGLDAHSPVLRETVPEFNWFFTTKSAHISEFETQFDYHSASFLPHAADPETHMPVSVTDKDRQRYACDASFIGSYSDKKARVLSELLSRMPDLDLRIWGSAGWAGTEGKVAGAFSGGPVFGTEYAKAIGLSKINLGLLFEGNAGAAPDTITARTFEIPGAGGFMLHERTTEAEAYFVDGKEAVFFDEAEDLADKIDHYLQDENARQQIATAGHARSLASDYFTDAPAQAVIDKFQTLRTPHPTTKGLL